MEQARQLFIHAKSLVLARMFKTAYWSLGGSHPITQNLLERYRKTRRELPGGYDSRKGYSTRYGAHEAFQETQ